MVINGLASGVSTGILLALVGVQPAFFFGVLAFLGEFVPIIGPVIVAIPALFVAASMGFAKFGLALLDKPGEIDAQNSRNASAATDRREQT